MASTDGEPHAGAGDQVTVAAQAAVFEGDGLAGADGHGRHVRVAALVHPRVPASTRDHQGRPDRNARTRSTQRARSGAARAALQPDVAPVGVIGVVAVPGVRHDEPQVPSAPDVHASLHGSVTARQTRGAVEQGVVTVDLEGHAALLMNLVVHTDARHEDRASGRHTVGESTRGVDAHTVREGRAAHGEAAAVVIVLLTVAAVRLGGAPAVAGQDRLEGREGVGGRRGDRHGQGQQCGDEEVHVMSQEKT